jgi:hypothetical protein
MHRYFDDAKIYDNPSAYHRADSCGGTKRGDHYVDNYNVLGLEKEFDSTESLRCEFLFPDAIESVKKGLTEKERNPKRLERNKIRFQRAFNCFMERLVWYLWFNGNQKNVFFKIVNGNKKKYLLVNVDYKPKYGEYSGKLGKGGDINIERGIAHRKRIQDAMLAFHRCLNCILSRRSKPSSFQLDQFIYRVNKYIDIDELKLITTYKPSVLISNSASIAQRKRSFKRGCPRRTIEYYRAQQEADFPTLGSAVKTRNGGNRTRKVRKNSSS